MNISVDLLRELLSCPGADADADELETQLKYDGVL